MGVAPPRFFEKSINRGRACSMQTETSISIARLIAFENALYHC